MVSILYQSVFIVSTLYHCIHTVSLLSTPGSRPRLTGRRRRSAPGWRLRPLARRPRRASWRRRGRRNWGWVSMGGRRCCYVSSLASPEEEGRWGAEERAGEEGGGKEEGDRREVRPAQGYRQRFWGWVTGLGDITSHRWLIIIYFEKKNSKLYAKSITAELWG